MRLAKIALLLSVASATGLAQINVGEQKPEANLPFTMTTTSTFGLPWRIAFLPDGRMLVTEKIGPVWLVSARERRSARSPARRPFTGKVRTACTACSSRRATPPTRAST